jgi:hypothetical protein
MPLRLTPIAHIKKSVAIRMNRRTYRSSVLNQDLRNGIMRCEARVPERGAGQLAQSTPAERRLNFTRPEFGARG